MTRPHECERAVVVPDTCRVDDVASAPLAAANAPASPGVFARINAYLIREYRLLKRGDDLTRPQLLAKLQASTLDDRQLRKESSQLMVLITADIKRDRDFPVPGVPADAYRPMRAWRQRYNGLQRFLPKPS